MKEELEKKIKGIIGLYNFYKHQMNTVERVALLTMWIEQSVNKEEFEVAASLQKELDKITSGQEEYHLIAPALIPPTPKVTPQVTPQVSLINYWFTDRFEIFSIHLKPFRFVFLNLGFEVK